MKALFIHDHKFIKNAKDGILYTSGNLNSKLWNRYLSHFDTVTVIGRCIKADDTSRYNTAEYKNVNFNLFDNVAGGADYFKKRKEIEVKLKKEISSHDVIIMRFPATISIFAAQYCKKKDIPYVAEVVGCSWDGNWNYGGLAPKIVAPYSFIHMKKAVKNAFASIYVTRYFLQNRYPTNSKIVANASNVILNFIEQSALPKRIDKINNSSENSIHIGIIGDISVKYKGYDILLKAIKKLPSAIQKKITISFVGGGNPSYLKSIIEKNNLTSQAKILGKLKAGEEVFNFLDTLDLYVHPSRQEGLPRVVIEAMSRACPVLSSSVAGTPELIDEKYMHKPGDYVKLSNDILYLANNKIKLKEIAKINFEKSKEYLFETLEQRRSIFFSEIANYIDK